MQQERAIARVQRSAGRVLPDDLDYSAIDSLSNEERQKLSQARPRTLQEASEISGVTPHGLTRILFALRAYDGAAAAAGSTAGERTDAERGHGRRRSSAERPLHQMQLARIHRAENDTLAAAVAMGVRRPDHVALPRRLTVVSA